MAVPSPEGEGSVIAYSVTWCKDMTPGVDMRSHLHWSEWVWVVGALYVGFDFEMLNLNY